MWPVCSQRVPAGDAGWDRAKSHEKELKWGRSEGSIRNGYGGRAWGRRKAAFRGPGNEAVGLYWRSRGRDEDLRPSTYFPAQSGL